MNIRISALVLLTLAAHIVPSSAMDIQLVEAMTAPTPGNPRFVVIKNFSRDPVDMTHWIAYFGYLQTDGLSIQPFESIVLSSADEATTRAAYVFPPNVRILDLGPNAMSGPGNYVIERENEIVVMAMAVNSTPPGNALSLLAAQGEGHSLVRSGSQFVRPYDGEEVCGWELSSTNRCRNPQGQIDGQQTVVDYTSTWNYLPVTGYVPPSWSSTDNNTWPNGTGCFGFETQPNMIPAPGMVTPIGSMGNVMTYLFQTSFHFNGDPDEARFIIDQIVDDGVRYYLNGHLLGSTRVPEKGYLEQPATPVTNAIEELAEQRGYAWGLKRGLNIFCAEVHQWSPGSSDMVFAARLKIIPRPRLRLSEVHFTANRTIDWVELQNPSTDPASATGLFLASKTDFSDKIALNGTVSANGFISYDVALPGNTASLSATDVAQVFLIDGFNNVLGVAKFPEIEPSVSYEASWPAPERKKLAYALAFRMPGWSALYGPTRNAANNGYAPAVSMAWSQFTLLVDQGVLLVPNSYGDNEFFSADPDSGADIRNWYYNSSGDGNSAYVSFSKPGIHQVATHSRNQLHPSVDTFTPIARNVVDIHVAHRDDIDFFDRYTLNPTFRESSVATIGNRRYSLADRPGSLHLVQEDEVQEQLTYGFGIWKPMVSWESAQTIVEVPQNPAKRPPFAGFRAGDFAFGINDANQLVVFQLQGIQLFSRPINYTRAMLRVTQTDKIRFQILTHEWETVFEIQDLTSQYIGVIQRGHGESWFDDLLIVSSRSGPGPLNDLRITEIMTDQRAQGSVPYWEITNVGRSPLDLEGLQLWSETLSKFSPRALRKILWAGQSAIITGNKAAFQQAYGTSPYVILEAPDLLAYGGQFFDNLDVYTPYGGYTTRYPELTRPDGVAIEIINARAPNISGSQNSWQAYNWKTLVNPTPGSFGSNAPPTFSLRSAEEFLPSGHDYHLDASWSFDVSGPELTWDWTVSPTAGASLSVEPYGKATVNFTSAGNYVVTVGVTDQSGKRSTASLGFWGGNPVAQTDSDGDGHSDASEAKFGTNPLDGASRYNLQIDFTLGSNLLRCEWPSVAGQLYKLEYTETLGAYWEVVSTVVGNGSPEFWLGTSIDPQKQRGFFRIVAP